MTIQVNVRDDVLRDALQLIAYRPLSERTGRPVSVAAIDAGDGSRAPILRMVVLTDDKAQDLTQEAMGLAIQYDVARALYEALGRYFGDHQDPASRELVDSLGARILTEELRVDKMLDAVLATVLPSTRGEEG